MYVWTATVAFGVASVAFIPPLTAAGAGAVAVVLAVALTIGPLRGRRNGGSAERGGPAAAAANGARNGASAGAPGAPGVPLPQGEHREAVR
jgi:hypothetical protein